VAFDGQLTVDGTDAVDAPQPQRSRSVSEYSQPSDGLADRGDPVQDLSGNGCRAAGSWRDCSWLVTPLGGAQAVTALGEPHRHVIDKLRRLKLFSFTPPSERI